MDYLIYFFDDTGHIVARRDIACDSVEEAMTLARTFGVPPSGKLEVWHLATHVATIPQARNCSRAISGTA
jgi:hypothetical protein